MKSLAVEKDHSLRFIDIPTPTIDKSSALVKVLAGGICGTDMKIIHGTFKNCRNYPILLGHESVGEIVEVGSDVTVFKAGDLVLLPYIDGVVDGYTSFFGGFSEYGVVHDWRSMARSGKGPNTAGFNDFFYTQKTIPAGYDPVDSVMIITLREVLGAVQHFNFQPGQSLVVFGGGSVGLSFVKFAKLIGMGPVFLVDVLEEKIKKAADAGADYAYNSTKTDITEQIRGICPDGVDYTLDAVGVNGLLDTSLQLIRMGGKMLVYGIDAKMSHTFDWSNAPSNWQLDFFWSPEKFIEAEVHDQLINWIDMGLINPGEYVSHQFSFKEALKGFDILEKRQPAEKIVLTF